MALPGVAAVPPPLVPEEGDDDVLSGWTPTIGSLFSSGHHKWGFLVYRTTYDDDKAWTRFMDVLTRSTEVALRQAGKDARLQPYLDWKVVQDRTLFDGASKDAVCEHFLDWVATRSDERDGPGAAREDVPRKSPRYRACLYVDKEAVEAASMESAGRHGMEFYYYSGRVVVINAEPPLPVRQGDEEEEEDEDEDEEDDEEDDQHPPVDGRTDYDIGWMFVPLEYTGVIYNRLAEGWDSWVDAYKRPPATWTGRY